MRQLIKRKENYFYIKVTVKRMTRANCENCMWGDQCSAEDICSFYDPLCEEYIAQPDSRHEFYEEWNAYIKLWNYEKEGVEHCLYHWNYL